LRLIPALRAARVTDPLAARVTMKVTALFEVHSPKRRGRRGRERRCNARVLVGSEADDAASTDAVL
jgi:hypothetical protein